MDQQHINRVIHGMSTEGKNLVSALFSRCRELKRQNEILEGESAQLEVELASEQAISARFLRERDDGIGAIRLEMSRLTAELATEQTIVDRLFQERSQHAGASRQHVVLSSNIGNYTSQFLDAKSVSERAALLASIHSTTKIIWGSGMNYNGDEITNIMRTMMGDHGFVFREPGEGETVSARHVTMVPLVAAARGLDRLVNARLEYLGSRQLYLVQLGTVVLRVAEYLETNP